MNTTETARLFDQVSAQCLVGGIVSSPDLDRYRHYVAHLEMPEARKDDMMLAVYRIMQSFVDRAFGDDPVQQSGRLEDKMRGKDESAVCAVIQSGHSSSIDENQALHDEFRRCVMRKQTTKKRDKP